MLSGQNGLNKLKAIIPKEKTRDAVIEEIEKSLLTVSNLKVRIKKEAETCGFTPKEMEDLESAIFNDPDIELMEMIGTFMTIAHQGYRKM